MSEDKKQTKTISFDKIEEILKKSKNQILDQNEIDMLLTAISSDYEYKPETKDENN